MNATNNVNDLLPRDFDGLDQVLKEEVKRDSPLAAKAIPNFAWRIVGNKANRAINDVLNFNVIELLANAWSHAAELHEFSDPSKYPPGKEWSIFLGQHELTTTVDPVLSVEVSNIKAKKIRFTVELAAQIRSAELSIRAGRIVAIGGADCSVSAQLKYYDTKFHNPLKSREIVFLERYELQPPGLAILP